MVKELDLKLEKGKAVCFDFDGVIHKYSKGWQDGSIYDEYNKEIITLMCLLQKVGIPVFICSTRDKWQILNWWNGQSFWCSACLIRDEDIFWNSLKEIGITNKKMPAQLYIDDRAYKYNGQTTKEVLFDLSNGEVSLTEEKKKAIEHLKQIIESYIEADECGLSNNDFKKEIQDLSIVLKLINDQQKEIEEKDREKDLILTDITEEKISKDDWCKCMILHTGCKNEWTCKECLKEYYFNKGRNV